MAKKKKGFLSKLLWTGIGVGLAAYSLNKLKEETEDEKIISKEDYEDEMKKDKVYINLDVNDKIEFFNRDLIENTANADKLFLKLLDKIEETSEIANKEFKISDIEKLIPFESTNMSSKSTYNYSVMSMLGGQSSRDYFVFLDNQNLRDIFTEECNSESRDNNLWREYLDERFKINSKYIKK